MGDWLIRGVFGIWLLLTVLVLFPKLNPVIRGLDLLALVPEWRFFAPIPGQHDYHVLYRDEFVDGSVTDWTELPLVSDRRWWNIAWNPGKRGNKALFDAVSEFAVHVGAGDKSVEISIPFLTLLNYISSVARPVVPQYTQFLLMSSQGSLPDHEPDVFST